jgi:drug/metabolite transporter (DMT)-like permease
VNNEKQGEQFFIWGMVLSMTCWGFSWSSGKVLSAYGDPLTISFVRFIFTFGSLFFILLFLKDSFTIKRTGSLDLIIASILLTIYTWLFFKGLETGKAGAGGVLVTVLNPIIAYAITLVLSRRRPTKNESLGLVLGLIAGIVLLKIFDSPENVFSAGNIFFVAAAVVWALLSRFTARAGRHGSSVSFSFWLYGLSSLILILLTGTSSVVKVMENGDKLFWWNLFFSSTITTSLATTFYFVATARVGASRASSFIFLVPFSAALGSWLFLDENIEIHTIIGGLLGIAAVYILNKRDTRAS